MKLLAHKDHRPSGVRYAAFEHDALVYILFAPYDYDYVELEIGDPLPKPTSVEMQREQFSRKPRVTGPFISVYNSLLFSDELLRRCALQVGHVRRPAKLTRREWEEALIDPSPLFMELML